MSILENSILEKLQEAASTLNSHLKEKPKVAVVLGSGLAGILDEVTIEQKIPFDQIPHFPLPSVVGHQGEMVLAKVKELPVLFLKGRVHGYEGYSQDEVVFPIRLLKLLGVETVVLTNAAGGVNASFNPGEIMLIEDHINLMGKNPLIGPNLSEFGERFPDMSEVYNLKLGELSQSLSKKLNLELKKGVYVGMTGPSFETPAEIRMLQKLGGDAVGMSTVPEAIAANHAGMQVLGFSMISNKAAGLSPSKLTHQEVLEEGEKAGKKLGQLILSVLENL